MPRDLCSGTGFSQNLLISAWQHMQRHWNSLNQVYQCLTPKCGHIKQNTGYGLELSQDNDCTFCNCCYFLRAFLLPGKDMSMYYMIDNYDSFVYNLYAYMLENGQDILVRRADEVSFEELEQLYVDGMLDGILISPGPKRPEDASVSAEILRSYQGKVPVLGVCLGHQLIGLHYGAEVTHGTTPVHGKISRICHNGDDLFQGLPDQYKVTRYHSLVVTEKSLPPELVITARTEDGVIMGLKHRDFPVYGIQFHPEAVLTEYGHELLQNFHRICQSRKNNSFERRAAV